jgi:FAD synthetase
MHVLLFGTFDHLHPGHRSVIDAAFARAESSGTVTIVIARDRNVQHIKDRSPDHNEIERQSIVQEAYPKARVILGDAKDFLAPVRAVRPDVILLGYDQRMPPGVNEADLGCAIERQPALEPSKYKSSLMRRT